MAGNSRRNSSSAGTGRARTGAASSARRNVKKGQKRRQTPKKGRTGIREEILFWTMLSVSILIFISVLGLGGTIGGKIRTLFFGLFGFMTYIVPFVLFFSAAFLISNGGKWVAWMKTAAAYVFVMSLCAFFELVVNGYTQGQKIMDYYQFGTKFQSGGGLAGGILCKAFCPTVGVVGAYVLIIMLVVICLVLITERSLFAGMKKKTSRVYETAKKDASRRKEIQTAKREQRQMQRDIVKEQELKDVLEKIRAESTGVIIKERTEKSPEKRGTDRIRKKKSGVSMNTELDRSQTDKAEEVHEVMPSLKKTAEASQIDFTIEGVDKSETSGEQTRQKADLEPFIIERAQPLAQEDTINPYHENETASSFEMEEPESEEAEMPELKIPQLHVPQERPRQKAKTVHLSKKESESEKEAVLQEVEQSIMAVRPEYVFPSMELLKKPARGKRGDSDKILRETAAKLQTTLHNFGVDVTVTNVSCGPSVTRYELMPQQGVKVSRIVNLSDDIKLNLAAADIRIEAPIPGKSAVGIEVPNHENSAVMLRELLETDEFKNHPSNLAFAAGKDISGKVVVTDIAKMPHLLIAGATGSGKSVCINTIIMSILYKARPEDVKLIMIDPKVVELSVYNGIPHLMIPVVTDPKKAAGALNWGVAEMTERYKKFADLNVRDLKGYNAKIESVADLPDEAGDRPQKLPQVVIIVDELADLMMVAPGEVEDSICRLAQLARAAGIHLIIATQRPSVNVITGLIKANMPSRIAFSVSSGVDSRTIIDMNGAEKLLGKGDMLFYPQGYQKPARVQGAFVSDGEVSDVVEFLGTNNTAGEYSQEMEEKISQAQQAVAEGASGSSEVDTYFKDAGKFIIEKDKASIGMLQRVFKIGFNRAARIMDQLAESGVVGEEEGTKPRKVLMSMEEFENYVDEYI